MKELKSLTYQERLELEIQIPGECGFCENCKDLKSPEAQEIFDSGAFVDGKGEKLCLHHSRKVDNCKSACSRMRADLEKFLAENPEAMA